MARRTDPALGTIRSEGGLLPSVLLLVLAREPERLSGTDPSSFDADSDAQVQEIIGSAWSALSARWERLTAPKAKSEAQNDDRRRLARSEDWTIHLLEQLGWLDIIEKSGKKPGTASEEDPDDDWPEFVTHEFETQVPIAVLPWGMEMDQRPSVGAGTPHAVLQTFLNRSSGHLWGILSNGRTIRVLRDSSSLTRTAYLEIDLDAMFSGQVYSDFALLWRVLHATRFRGSPGPEECWLERWQRDSSTHGVRLLERLREGVRVSIEELGTGLLMHPANVGLRQRIYDGSLPTMGFHQQLLRLVYQVIFLLVLEQRDQLHEPDADAERRHLYRDHYSFVDIQRRARRHVGGRHPDLWRRIRVVVDGLSSSAGIPALGLPSLTSGLFDPSATADLVETEMGNRSVLAAFRAIGETLEDGRATPVDYRYIGAEELGSVYESLLELVAEADVEARTFRLTDAAENERRATGAFYTPPALVAQVLERALDPVILQVTNGLEAAEAEAALLQITVLDPTCGSAHFLVGAGHRLARHLARIRTGDEEPALPAVQEALRDVVSTCLYGVDINPMAVELAKVSLWLEAHVPGRPLTFLDHHFASGDSLLGAWVDELVSGIPDEAFQRTPGDDARTATAWRKRNGELRGGQATLGLEAPSSAISELVSAANAVAAEDDRTPAGIRRKQAAARRAQEDPARRRMVALADTWVGAFLAVKEKGSIPDIVDRHYAIRDGNSEMVDSHDRQSTLAAQDASERRALHWELAFPERAQPGGMFDVVIGNPPYLRGKDHAQADPRGRAFVSWRYPSCTGSQWNLYVPFILLAARLARRRSALIVQSSVLGAQYAGALHQTLLTDYGIEAVLDLSKVPNLFSGAAVQVACLVVSREPSHETRFVRFGDGLVTTNEAVVTRSELDRLPEGYWTLPTSGLAQDLIELFLSAEVRLGDIADIRDGMEQQAAYDVIGLVREADDRSGELRLLPTGLIDPFRIRWGEQRVRYLKSEHQRPVLDIEALEASGFSAMAEQGRAEKICIGGMGSRIEAVVDEGKHLVSKSAYVIRLTDPDVCPYAIAAYLNSRTANLLYDGAFGALGFGAGSVNYRPPTLGAMPLPPLSLLLRTSKTPAGSESLSALGRRIHQRIAQQESEPVTEVELEEVDQAVRQAFGISD
jgi:hypothetical protein